MPLSSSSTLAEVEAAYDDNASFEEDRDVTKCRAFMTAVRILLRRNPEEAGTRESNAKFRMDLLADELKRAQQWLAANDTGSAGASGPSVIHQDFSSFRR
jgi:hypothetical protein